MKLRFHRLVQVEANDAISWYEDQRSGLGDEFFDTFISLIDEIASNPDGFPFWLASNTIRNAKMKRFPYSVLFEILPLKVKILCLRHEKRHPKYGTGRH